MLSWPSPSRLRSQFSESANAWRTEWYDRFQPRDERTYSIEAEYSKTLYGYLLELSRNVDAKADSLFKFAATAAGAVIGAAKAFDADPVTMYFLAPSLVFFATAIVAAVIAKQAYDLSLPIAPDWFLELEGNDAFVRANVAASYHVATKTMASLTSWKAEWVNRSTGLLVFALLLVPAGLVANALC